VEERPGNKSSETKALVKIFMCTTAHLSSLSLEDITEDVAHKQESRGNGRGFLGSMKTYGVRIIS
jgi:hypothetical protein